MTFPRVYIYIYIYIYMDTSLYSLDDSFNIVLPERKHVAGLMELGIITSYCVLDWTFVED